MPEYYKLVWAYVHEEFSSELLENSVTKPTAFRRDILLKVMDEFNSSDTTRKHQILDSILTSIEFEFERTLSEHSVFYWLHIYRRIAPHLARELGNNTDEQTVVAVRNYLEQAIYKYGRLSENHDYSLSSDVEFEDILGGLLESRIKKTLNKKQADYYKSLIQESKQWVLTSFDESSIFDIYYLEGIAYQYWYILAKMRAIGKGIDAQIDKQGYINENRTTEQEFLIKSFDYRNLENSPSFGMTTNVGTFVKSDLGSIENIILCALINSGRRKLSDLGIKAELSDYSPNFIPFFINIDLFYKSHKYLEKKFKKKFGFGILELCQFVSALSYSGLSSVPDELFNIKGSKNKAWLALYSNFQRGYKLYNLSPQELKLKINSCFSLLNNSGIFIESDLENQIDDILDFVTLEESTQSNMGIWSNGPKPILIKSNDHYILDYSSIYYLFKNLFFGLKSYDSKNTKGFEFENQLGELARNNGFDVILESSEIKTKYQKREVDVGIRMDNKLYLFECKCFERPLNFDKGEPRTINYRIEELEKKLEQADTLREFVLDNRKGNNFDFSWATEVHSFVVSSYTEWVWSESEQLWAKDRELPRILSVYEVIELLKSEKSAA